MTVATCIEIEVKHVTKKGDKNHKFSLNGTGILINGMNYNQFRNPISHMCLVGTVVASWSLIQKMACSNPFTAMTNFLSLNFLNSMKSSGETNICLHTTWDFLDRSILWILPDQNRSLLFSGNSDSLKKGNKFNEPC